MLTGAEKREDQSTRQKEPEVTRPGFRGRKIKAELEKGLHNPQMNGHPAPSFPTQRGSFIG